MQVTGLEEFSKKLLSLGSAGEGIAKAALYDGAAVLADKIRANIEALPEDDARWLSGEDKYSVITKRDKKDLLDHLGIAKMRTAGGQVSTVVGFNGYGSTPTKKHPKGKPMAMIARSIESGSTVRRKHPFVRPAVNAVKNQVKETMAETAREQARKTMEG